MLWSLLKNFSTFVFVFKTRLSENILTEDQCKQCSTTWFILLKEVKKITLTVMIFMHYLMHNVIWMNSQYPHSVGRWPCCITSWMASHSTRSCFLHLCWNLSDFPHAPDRPPPLALPSSPNPFQEVLVQATTLTSVGHSFRIKHASA